MRKNYISISLICLSFGFFALSCSLNRDPLSVYSDVTEGVTHDSVQVIFKDKQAAISHRQVVKDLLKKTQEAWYEDVLLLAETHSDNSYAGTPGAETTPFETNSIEGSNINLERDWKSYMSNIANANKFIVGVEQLSDPALLDAERKQYIAEGKIMRAMLYFDMVRIWGSIPLVTTMAGDITSESIKRVYPEYFPPQSTELEVYKQIERDLLEALPDALANNPADKTLLSKSVAHALLAKVYAEKPLRDYNKVIQYANELESAGFDLVTDFGDLFGVKLEHPSEAPSATNPATDAKARNTIESIYEAQYGDDGNWVTWMFGRPLDDWNNSFKWAKWITPSRDLIKAYLSENGDKRYPETVVWYSCTWSNYYPKDNYAFMYKCRSKFNSIVKMRYADILLLKAEALIHNGDLQGATTIINRIRNRAGLNNLNPTATVSKETLLKAYLHERRLELALEGHRWFDLVRLDQVEEVMNSICAKDIGRPAMKYAYNTTSYRLPIPEAIMVQNPNLVQNPGY